MAFAEDAQEDASQVVFSDSQIDLLSTELWICCTIDDLVSSLNDFDDDPFQLPFTNETNLKGRGRFLSFSDNSSIKYQDENDEIYQLKIFKAQRQIEMLVIAQQQPDTVFGRGFDTATIRPR